MLTDPADAVRERFGDIDIYLFDQILRGRIAAGSRVLDAGCGVGRNLVWLLREGYDVYEADQDSRAIEAVRRLAGALAPLLPHDHFGVESVEAMSFPDALADVVISSAVLHFARDDDHFRAMLAEMWRVLRPGGLLFCRLASTIGIERLVRPIAGRRFHLPDGSQRFLVDEQMLIEATEQLGGVLADPLRTTVVQNARSMTTCGLRKTSGAKSSLARAERTRLMRFSEGYRRRK